MELFKKKSTDKAKLKSKSKKKKTSKDITREIISGIGIPLVLALMIKASVVEAYIIPSGSMENTLLPGEQIMGNKFVYGMRLPIPYVDIRLPSIEEPKQGDIVVFRYPENKSVNYIKRCIATEGQTVEIKNKKVYVDGVLMELPEEGKYTDNRMIPFMKNAQRRGGWRDNIPAFKVPEGKLFMMGDNRDNSFDSRFWGFVDREDVLARALFVLWSWEYPGPLDTNGGKLSSLDIWKYTLSNIGYLSTHIRWNRLFNIAS